MSSIKDSSDSLPVVPNLIGFKIFDDVESLMGSDTVNDLVKFLRWPVPFTPNNGCCSNTSDDLVADTDASDELFLAEIDDDRFGAVESVLVDDGVVSWLSLLAGNSGDDDFSNGVIVCRFFRTITEYGRTSSKLEITWYVS